MSQATLQEMMQVNASLAVNKHPELDYSEGSLVRLEQILDGIHRQQPGRFSKLFKKGLTDEQLNSACNVYGAYLGEVLVRHLQAEWIWNSFDGENEPTVRAIGATKNMDSYPFNKIYKRITFGADEDITYYYKVMQQILAG